MARILIVEPHADVRSLLEHVVRRIGHEPMGMNGTDAGLLNADAAVIEPSDVSGLAIARLMRELGRPFVFTSIFPAEREALDLEPVAYFVKPFALHHLEDALVAALADESIPVSHGTAA